MEDASARVVKSRPAPCLSHRVSPRRVRRNALSTPVAAGYNAGSPKSGRAQYHVSPRRCGHHTLKPRSAVTRVPSGCGPQPGMSDITHTTVKPTPTPTCRTHHHSRTDRTTCVHYGFLTARAASDMPGCGPHPEGTRVTADRGFRACAGDAAVDDGEGGRKRTARGATARDGAMPWNLRAACDSGR